ncbi:hypothetical protein [Motiliproteus sp. MSK22-1]|uniref:hypothetical protein n=1 Tax=Motiliproteus sp. MSK22-1 TaxID=1897630 RepID=UPI000977E2D2|nr:hypothetical protein [Motiliproteus sp. MSK22-1]OMH39068.1 hypothetical protein BGP75_04980 [Motiliproteus sp. MSK22-1]
MKANEIVHARIDALTGGLGSAIRKTDGAQFALMLSMISESKHLVSHLEAASQDSLPSEQVESRDELYTSEVVGRLNNALRKGNMGDLQLLISWLDTVPLEGRQRPVQRGAEIGEGNVPLSQAAVLAGRYSMLEEIKDSRLRVAA